jgi:hypothetical protein
MQTDSIRWLSNRTIDFESYRREAHALREQAKAEFFGSAGRTVVPLIRVAAIAIAFIFALCLMFPVLAAAEVSSEIAAPGEILITTAHAVGAQIYECKPDSAGKLVWQFREPIATLFIDGKTVGRHYAGPVWEMADGSMVRGKVVAQATGADPGDILLLKMNAMPLGGPGQLNRITTVLRLNTRGGRMDGSCDSSGSFLSVPYSADYAFYRKAADPLSNQTH